MSENAVTLDVREDIRAGREPFARIMQTVAGLKEEESLRLIAPFEPVPLFAVLARRGFAHESRVTASGDWEVLFTRNPAAGACACETSASSKSSRVATGETKGDAPNVIEVDARGLEPPQPLVIILETVMHAPAGAEVRARTDRRPMHLYAHLTARGFAGETHELKDGSFVTHISRR